MVEKFVTRGKNRNIVEVATDYYLTDDHVNR